jgi:hypothetical protein
MIHERILNHYNSRESNSNFPIRIRIEFFHFFKILIRRIEYSNTPAHTWTAWQTLVLSQSCENKFHVPQVVFGGLTEYEDIVLINHDEVIQIFP